MSSASTEPAAVLQRSLPPGPDPATFCRALRQDGASLVWFDGTGGFPRPWCVSPLVAVRPVARLHRNERGGLPPSVERLILRRRSLGGPPETGVAVALPYEPGGDALVLEVDRSVRFQGDAPLLTVRGGSGPDRAAPLEEIERIAVLFERQLPVAPRPAARVCGPVTTSLGRNAYVESVARIQRHIAAGDVYQANLCQRFEACFEGDPFEFHVRLAAERPAPMSAFLEVDGLALASISPEIFLRCAPPDRISTFPIKGTRPRGRTAESDAGARDDLLRSEKDRAELTMIVDLERNDLGRVCRPGSVRVNRNASLETFATVHHLVAEVEGRLRPGVGPLDLVRATFPGGSITGAPKLRAMEILSGVEPVRRSFFTGSLFWFGDDGSADSSILIRTVEFREGRAWLGAGGGIVADSDPVAEWRESNHKAAALAHQLGFDPAEIR